MVVKKKVRGGWQVTFYTYKTRVGKVLAMLKVEAQKVLSSFNIGA